MQKRYKKGLKMFQKLGGQIGAGIGKDEQGIVAPILSVKVNDGGGLGFSQIKKSNVDKKLNQKIQNFAKKIAGKKQQEGQQDEIGDQMNEEVTPFYSKIKRNKVKNTNNVKSKNQSSSAQVIVAYILQSQTQQQAGLQVLDLRQFTPQQKYITKQNGASICKENNQDQSRLLEKKSLLRSYQLDLQAIYHRKNFSQQKIAEIQNSIVKEQKDLSVSKSNHQQLSLFVKLYQANIVKVFNQNIESTMRDMHVSALQAHQFYSYCIKQYWTQALCSIRLYERYKLNHQLTSILIQRLKRDIMQNWSLKRQDTAVITQYDFDVAYNFDIYDDIRQFFKKCDDLSNNLRENQSNGGGGIFQQNQAQ